MAQTKTTGDNPPDALNPGPGASGAAAEPTDEIPEEKPAANATGGDEAPRPTVPAQCLTFQLAGEEYAVGILQIREIVEYDTLTTVPMTPPWIRGVMNLRGTVVPVVDLAVKFGLPETEVTPRTCTVIVEVDLDGEETLMGVMVDAVVRVLDLAPEDVEEPPAFGTQVRVDYLLGVGRVDDDLVLLLDVDRILSLDELLAVAAVPATAEEEGLLAGDSTTDDSFATVARENGETAETDS